ncbi:MAG: PAS domain S-box protein [Draconibacterium sp.]|nr:PAS domain S-box protein [Draconibacterium sp.]
MSELNKYFAKNPFSGETILQGMPELAYVFTKDDKFVMWNKNVETVLGYSASELHNKSGSDLLEKKYQKRTTEAITKIFTEKNEQTIEYNLITKSGELLPYIGSGSYAIVNGQEFYIGMAINISKLKNTEEKLKNVVTELNNLKEQLEAENTYLREEIISGHDFTNIIGESEPLMHSLFRVEQVAKMDTTVLLEGETGTGKELFAIAIHNKSNRKNRPFVKVNCASLPATLIESELFGHEKGAFTGAIQKQIGRFELANVGTIFLDEIGEIPFELQSKLLRVLQEGEFERLGSPRTIKVDVRIIAATNKNLEKQIAKKLFRKDLYYRLNVYPITIAPLRDRIADIPQLTKHFIDIFNRKMGRNIKRISRKTIQQLQEYSWPGNIRELENIIERAVIISPSTNLIIEQLQKPEFEEMGKLLPLAEYERRYIIKVLGKTYWKVDGSNGAANILDMNPETLRSRMRKLEIKRPNS